MQVFPFILVILSLFVFLTIIYEKTLILQKFCWIEKIFTRFRILFGGFHKYWIIFLNGREKRFMWFKRDPSGYITRIFRDNNHLENLYLLMEAPDTLKRKFLPVSIQHENESKNNFFFKIPPPSERSLTLGGFRYYLLKLGGYLGFEFENNISCW